MSDVTTKFQALFIKYLATRMDTVWGKGNTIRNIAMYYYSRYPHLIEDWPVYYDYYDSTKKWWEQDFFTSQLDGCIILDEAAYFLNDFKYVPHTNWNPTRTKNSDEWYAHLLPENRNKKENK